MILGYLDPLGYSAHQEALQIVRWKVLGLRVFSRDFSKEGLSCRYRGICSGLNKELPTEDAVRITLLNSHI